MPRPDLPDFEQSCALAAWLAAPRARLLRRAQIGLRRRVLEVGCGYGIITAELVRRAAGQVVALDRDIRPALAQRLQGVRLIAGDACALPFPPASFDLVFFANVLMWADAAQAVREAARVLRPDGALVAMEPDFGGMLEHPPETALRDIWLRALRDAGADPEVGRKLPGLCEAEGLDVWVELQAMPRPADAAAVRLLEDLPLTEPARARVEAVKRQVYEATHASDREWGAFIHVPYFLIVATTP